MKFFLELRSCYRPSKSTAPSQQQQQQQQQEEEEVKEEEAIQVPPLPSSRHGHRQRHHARSMNVKFDRGSLSSPASHWRPGLQAINEDTTIVLDLAGKSNQRKTHRENKSKEGFSSKPQSPRVRYHEDIYFRNNNGPRMIMPALSPVPFMF